MKWCMTLSLLFVLSAGARAQSVQDWKCIISGDTRNINSNFQGVLTAMKNNTPGYKFIINVGDVVDHGYEETHTTGPAEWILWKSTIENYLGGTYQDSLPPKYMSCPGNHDYLSNPAGLANWKKYLWGQQQYGNDGKFFTFDYLDARFIVLDSEFSPNNGSQYQMLVNALEINPPKWIIAVWHKPLFSYGEKSYQDALNKLWGTILSQRGCDLIVTGDAHYYVRTKKLQLTGDKYPPLDSTNGVMVMVAGNGGAPIDIPNPTYDNNNYMIDSYAKTSADFGYTELHFQDSTLSVRHIFKNGTVFDQVVLTPNLKYQASVSVAKSDNVLPELHQQNFPNPFNNSTTIRFFITNESAVDILVYDLNGRLVRTLAEQVTFPRGERQMSWDGKSEGGGDLPSGAYFVRMRGMTYTQPLKMIMLK